MHNAFSAEALTSFSKQRSEKGHFNHTSKVLIAHLFRCVLNLGRIHAFSFFVNACLCIHSHFFEIKF